MKSVQCFIPYGPQSFAVHTAHKIPPLPPLCVSYATSLIDTPQPPLHSLVEAHGMGHTQVTRSAACLPRQPPSRVSEQSSVSHGWCRAGPRLYASSKAALCQASSRA